MELLLLLITALIAALIVAANSVSKLNKKNDSALAKNTELQDKVTALTVQNNELTKSNKELSVYQNSLNADKEAEERLIQAKEEVANILEAAHINAEAILLKANNEANKILLDAKNEFEITTAQTSEIKKDNRLLRQKAKEEAESMRENAVRQVNAILSDAELKAKEIAGEAFEVANNAKHYENVAKAMKNVIEGYGDEYLKPTFSLLDDLAEEFGFDEAGQMLKDARERTRVLVKSGSAAECDYVETNRKETAINFVTDAFNGKVDTIMSTLKKNNYGVLEQKIKDAYDLVNYLGQAFKKARITQFYLDARLDELKWAIIVNELKAKSIEEQRQIKEQIREEERSRREYEKAIKEAAKEEETIRKAMEKAQTAMSKANEEQKTKYEEQLRLLKEKLEEAESRNQRAISMAQQTKSGHVYVISNIGSFGENIFKIGMTRRLEPTDRVKELGDASVPFPFDIHAMIYSENAPKLESELHKYFVQNQVNKVNPRKEFFKTPIADIRKYLDDSNVDVKWTIAADALEYKETLAIEKVMSQDQKLKDDWYNRQVNAVNHEFDEEEDINS